MTDSHSIQWTQSFAAGAAGAAVLTSVHQMARGITADAPRMDVLGRRAIARTIQAAGGTVPSPRALQRMALAGDLLCNSAYYSLIACGRDAHLWRRAVVLGVAAGVGALLLPARLGLGDAPRSERPANQVMTVAWYLAGALTTAAAAARFRAATA
jgi:hypothetical protein